MALLDFFAWKGCARSVLFRRSQLREGESHGGQSPDRVTCARRYLRVHLAPSQDRTRTGHWILADLFSRHPFDYQFWRQQRFGGMRLAEVLNQTRLCLTRDEQHCQLPASRTVLERKMRTSHHSRPRPSCRRITRLSYAMSRPASRPAFARRRSRPHWRPTPSSSDSTGAVAAPSWPSKSEITGAQRSLTGLPLTCTANSPCWRVSCARTCTGCAPFISPGPMRAQLSHNPWDNRPPRIPARSRRNSLGAITSSRLRN